MDRINLIPKKRRLTRQRRVRVRLWVSAVVGYSAAALLVCMVYRAVSTPQNLVTLTDELAGLETELVSNQQQKDKLLPALREQRLILAAGRSITDQPDWSLLLTYLADQVLGDNIVLTGCTLAQDQDGDRAQDINNTGLAFTLKGYARTTPDVSRFVLRLEQMALFDKVKLISTNREPFLNAQAISFVTRCELQPGGGGNQ